MTTAFSVVAVPSVVTGVIAVPLLTSVKLLTLVLAVVLKNVTVGPTADPVVQPAKAPPVNDPPAALPSCFVAIRLLIV